MALSRITGRTKAERLYHAYGRLMYKTAFDILIGEASDMADSEIGAEISESFEDVGFSERRKKKMRALFKRERRREFHKNHPGAKRAAAVVLVLALASSAAAIYNTDAWREIKMHFMVVPGSLNTHINFSDERSTSYSDGFSTLGYIPQGFELTEDKSDEDVAALAFENGDEYFGFCASDLDVDSYYDTEDAVFDKTSVNGREAITVSKKNLNIVIWHDDDWHYSVDGGFIFTSHYDEPSDPRYRPCRIEISTGEVIYSD